MKPAGPALVGFSGGLDSTVLLHRLASQKSVRERGLRAIHVGHGLHADASTWTRHCRDFCESLGVALLVVDVRVDKDGGKGLEAAAREARHEAFADALRIGETLVLAHHRDDQAETVLLRLLRASGSEGLSAMRGLRPFAAGWLWRPLLQVSRTDLLEYANAHGLRWIEDPSNEDQGFDRNFLRHRLFPILRERWPRADTALARSAELLAEDASLLREEARKRLGQLHGPDPASLAVSGLLALERPWRTRVLREWLADQCLPVLPGNAYAIIESDLLLARPDANAEYRWGGSVLRRWREWLHAETQCEPLPADWSCTWNGATSLHLPTGDRLAFARTAASDDASTDAPGSIDAIVFEQAFGTLQVRARCGGERIVLPGRSHSHSLKQRLQEIGMPPWQRRRLPLILAEDGTVLAAGADIVSARLEQFCRAQALTLRYEPAARSAEI
jgi:tRNA(Ile)-lysidine synthase